VVLVFNHQKTQVRTSPHFSCPHAKNFSSSFLQMRRTPKGMHANPFPKMWRMLLLLRQKNTLRINLLRKRWWTKKKP
jgi:hypothetical protein